MTRDRMDNNAFEGGEAVLLAARGIPTEAVNGRGGGGGGPMGDGGRQDSAVSVEMGLGDVEMGLGDAERPTGGSPTPVTQTNGGPNCHCPPEKTPDRDSKSPSPPLPIVAQQSPWHRYKSIYLTVIVVSLVLWIVIFTIISQLNIA